MAWARNRNVQVNVMEERVDRTVAVAPPVSSGEPRRRQDDRRSDGRADCERLMRRLEAALNSLPARIFNAGAIPGRRASSCENKLAAVPHQALWAGSHSRDGPSGPFDIGRPDRLAARSCKRASCASAVL